MKTLGIIVAFAVVLYGFADQGIRALTNQTLAASDHVPGVIWASRLTEQKNLIDCSLQGPRKGWTVQHVCRQRFYARLFQTGRVEEFAKCDWVLLSDRKIRFICPQTVSL